MKIRKSKFLQAPILSVRGDICFKFCTCSDQRSWSYRYAKILFSSNILTHLVCIPES